MSGHSKWSKVKHQKEAIDAVKGKIFTRLANAIIIAVKESGGITDKEKNFKLRLAIERAKSSNMPKENIQRAIDRAVKGDSSQLLVTGVYEAYGPGGVGILIKVATDNKARTVAELKNQLEKSGGVLATSGAVSHLFKHVGLIEVEKGSHDYLEVLEAATDGGAIDLEEKNGSFNIYTEVNDLNKVREYLLQKGFTVITFDLYFRPNVYIEVPRESDRKKIGNILNGLEEREDVERVFANSQLHV